MARRRRRPGRKTVKPPPPPPPDRGGVDKTILSKMLDTVNRVAKAARSGAATSSSSSTSLAKSKKTKKKWTDDQLLKRFTTPGLPASFTDAQTLATELGLRPERVAAVLDQNLKLVQHRRVVRKFPRRKIIAGVHLQLAADLKDLSSIASHNSDYRYLLVTIDVTSRKMYARPLKRKTGREVAAAMSGIFDEIQRAGHRLPRKLMVDKGREFDCKEMRALTRGKGVDMFFVEDPSVKVNFTENF